MQTDQVLMSHGRDGDYSDLGIVHALIVSNLNGAFDDVYVMILQPSVTPKNLIHIISEPACQYMSVYEIGYHICTYMVKIYCNIRTVRILYVYTYMHVLYVYVCICLYISNPVTDILTYTYIY